MLLHRREVVNQPHQAIGFIKIQPLGRRIPEHEIAYHLRWQHIDNIMRVHTSTLAGAHLFGIASAIDKIIRHWHWRINAIDFTSDPFAGIIRTALRRVITTKRLNINTEQPPPPRSVQSPVQLHLTIVIPNRVFRAVLTTIGNRFSIAIHTDKQAVFKPTMLHDLNW